MPAVRVTEIADREEVRDGDGNLLYVELLVAVFDRDPLDPPGALVVSTEKVRVSPEVTPGRRQFRHLDSVTEEELEAYTSVVVDIDSAVLQATSKVQTRAQARENSRKWPQELLSS